MQTGIFDKTRLVANILMVVLVCLNIFFSVQYTQNIKSEQEQTEIDTIKSEERLKTSRFMKFFIDKVLGTNGTIAFEDRVKLESDIRALGDQTLTQQWEAFVASTDSESAQVAAVKLMSMLASKMI
jgi:preprotein translocase subunit YajC